VKAIVEKYRPGTKVNVRFRPANPEVCVLEPGVRKDALVILAVGGSLQL